MPCGPITLVVAGGGGGGAGSAYTCSLTSSAVTGGQTADGNGFITITWNFALPG